MNSRMKPLMVAATLAVTAFVTALPANAATVTYKTIRAGNLTNVTDAEGRWQFSGGNVMLGTTHVGYFVRKKRFSFGQASNKAAVETTIIWKWGSHALTAQGSHDFSSGAEVGGISATSAGFLAYKDATFAGTHNEMTITY